MSSIQNKFPTINYPFQPKLVTITTFIPHEKWHIPPVKVPQSIVLIKRIQLKLMYLWLKTVSPHIKVSTRYWSVINESDVKQTKSISNIPNPFSDKHLLGYQHITPWSDSSIWMCVGEIRDIATLLFIMCECVLFH